MSNGSVYISIKRVSGRYKQLSIDTFWRALEGGIESVYTRDATCVVTQLQASLCKPSVNWARSAWPDNKTELEVLDASVKINKFHHRIDDTGIGISPGFLHNAVSRTPSEAQIHQLRPGAERQPKGLVSLQWNQSHSFIETAILLRS